MSIFISNFWNRCPVEFLADTMNVFGNLKLHEIVLFVAGVLTIAPSLGANEPINRSKDRVPIGGRSISCEVFTPTQTDLTRGTILLFHGVGGIPGDGGMLRLYARSLAEAGFTAVIPSYFQSTGHWFITPGMAKRQGERWLPVVEELIRFYAARSPSGRVGVVGYSMGAFLAVGATRETGPLVSGLASLSGGVLEDHETIAWGSFPPILLIHGAEDRIVPPERSEALLQIAHSRQPRIRYLLYNNQGHFFHQVARRDVSLRLVEFFSPVPK